MATTEQPGVIRVHDRWRGTCPLCGPSLYVWVQGCPRRCRGCANEPALEMEGPAHELVPEVVCSEWAEAGGGLVLSGGEPFSQALPLAALCRLVRARSAHAPILVYTGYLLDELLSGKQPGWIELLREIDVLVDGPYVQERQCDFPLAGSDNQRVFLLSERVDGARLEALRRASVQVHLEPGGRLRLVGAGHRSMDMTSLVATLSDHGLSWR